MNQNNEKLSVLEKVGYSLGDLAANLIFQTLVTFLAFYYTDVYRISPGAASTIIFIGGMAGAFLFTPLMGLIADRTRTRWGKFRPWVLWTAIPFGVLSILAFTTPNLDYNAKIIYAMVTYLLLVMVYSANNLPYSALSGVLTGNMSDRNSLSSYRFVAVMVAQFMIQVLLLPLVLILGGGDKAVGFKITMTVFAAIGTIFFVITFLTTRERIVPTKEQESSIKTDLGDLLRNKPWLVMLVVTILVFVTLALRGGTTVYYFQNYLVEAQLAEFLDAVGFNSFINAINSGLTGMGLSEFKWPEEASASAFSLFNGCGIIFMIIGIFFSKMFADKFGKRNVYAAGLIVATFFISVIYVFPPDAIGMIFGAQILHGLTYGVTIPLLWAMIADVADYSEWRNNRRATAIIFSAMLMGLKAGLSIGGALVAGILAFYGYDASLTAQNADTVNGIRLAFSVISGVPWFMAAVLCFFVYEINKPMETRIEAELGVRRAL